MSPRHSREGLLRGAVEVAYEQGLARLSFGRVASHVGISDRTVVYYFPSREDLVAAVVTELGLRLQETLAAALDGPVADHQALVRTAWPLLARPDADRTLALFFETVGLASAGHPPYAALAPALLDAWVAWAAEHITGPAARRRAEAEAAVALTDGLLLVRQVSGARAANRAARVLGVL